MSQNPESANHGSQERTGVNGVSGNGSGHVPLPNVLTSWLNRSGGRALRPGSAIPPGPVAAEAVAAEPTTARHHAHRSSVSWPSWLGKLSLDRSTVTISIEGTSLRIISLVRQQVVGWTSIQLPGSLIRDGQIGDPADLGDAIDEAFGRLRLSRQHVAFALPGLQASTRILDLPRLKGQALHQAIAEELEHSLGLAVDDHYLFSQRLDGGIRSRYVFVLAIPKPIVLAALETLEAADIRPTTIDLRPLALARAIGSADAIIANLEEGMLDVAIVNRGVPTMLRSALLPLTTTNLEAAQNRLVDEVDRALRYHDDTSANRPLDAETPVYLTGRLATGISLAEKVRIATGHPIGRLSTGVTHPLDFPVSEYLVNIGLALKKR